jgi:hypothetical protein
MDMFFPFVIEVFGCFHHQVNSFFHRFVNMAWIAKGIEGPPLSMLRFFYRHRVSVALQKMNVAPISKLAITTREDLSRLGILFGLLPFPSINMLHAHGGGFGFVVPFPHYGLLLLSCLLVQTLVLAPCFFFSPFLGCFLKIKFGRFYHLVIYLAK